MFAHLAGDMRQNFVLVVKLNLEHRSRKDRRDRALKFDMLLAHSRLTYKKRERHCYVPLRENQVLTGVVPASAAASATLTSITTTATTAAPAKSAVRAFFTRARFADVHCAAVHILAIEALDGVLGFLRSSHGYECEPF